MNILNNLKTCYMNFLIKKSDSNKYLTAEQQEEMEAEFCDFIYQYNK